MAASTTTTLSHISNDDDNATTNSTNTTVEIDIDEASLRALHQLDQMRDMILQNKSIHSNSYSCDQNKQKSDAISYTSLIHSILHDNHKPINPDEVVQKMRTLLNDDEREAKRRGYEAVIQSWLVPKEEINVEDVEQRLDRVLLRGRQDRTKQKYTALIPLIIITTSCEFLGG
eukprot:CAMPEP_0116045118 /NCGR_PEP_ID=MMETSP0321-20121206/27414_1 /TAXON_ID=163516 /ORGANISM="Leptocylindrus danicus var. danicus, Strain B650" /LENGTH=172 /DNA_ID=CAMNT_0003526363 /DNA_START=238 /DNA_END=756 /DNA_ORIENTATION=-